MAGQMAANAMEKVSETFSFAKKVPMLMKATSDDDNPPSGYMYQEINSITYESISSCNSLLDFLVGRRLKQQSPYIKYKVLKVLCYIGSNGHSEFRSGLRHKADIVREAESFTGQMDKLRADALNQRVRATASELIELLFNVESSGTSTMRAMTGPTGKKMEGFGNSPSQPKKNKTWLDSMKNLAEPFSDATNRLKSKNEKEILPTTGRSGVTFVNYTDFSDADSDFKTFLDGDDSNQSSEEQESRESENTLSIEGHLVDDITSEGGIRAVPSKEALNQFTKRCSTLNIDKVLDALNYRLLEPVTEVQLKSLHVLEHLLKSDIYRVASRMSRCCTNLQEITKTESGNVLSKARKILLLINAKIEKERVQQDVHVTREGYNEDLLNVGEFGSSSSRLFAADDTPTLFSGMSLHSQPETASRSERTPSAEVFDVFQGLDLSCGNHTPEIDNPSIKAFQSSNSELDDLFFVTEESTGPTFLGKGQELVKKA
ncbi:AP-4 complex accessory subunit Tepsin [Desmophyllum pertusum]|uniref:AP-4 complex accessory subunit Tepsin n=1 Tax=Desmophyllum pertusum TaxID=174260 RepID=A0A9W9Z2W6_9CNID|nr:AP-4 complex accessory subunit Tepsin [Desmophyllum pertusum]